MGFSDVMEENRLLREVARLRKDLVEAGQSVRRAYEAAGNSPRNEKSTSLLDEEVQYLRAKMERDRADERIFLLETLVHKLSRSPHCPLHLREQADEILESVVVPDSRGFVITTLCLAVDAALNATEQNNILAIRNILNSAVESLGTNGYMEQAKLVLKIWDAARAECSGLIRRKAALHPDQKCARTLIGTAEAVAELEAPMRVVKGVAV